MAFGGGNEGRGDVLAMEPPASTHPGFRPAGRTGGTEPRVGATCFGSVKRGGRQFGRSAGKQLFYGKGRFLSWDAGAPARVQERIDALNSSIEAVNADLPRRVHECEQRIAVMECEWDREKHRRQEERRKELFLKRAKNWGTMTTTNSEGMPLPTEAPGGDAGAAIVIDRSAPRDLVEPAELREERATLRRLRGARKEAVPSIFNVIPEAEHSRREAMLAHAKAGTAASMLNMLMSLDMAQANEEEQRMAADILRKVRKYAEGGPGCQVCVIS